MSLSLCLYVFCKHRPLFQNQIFKIPITFYNARRQQSSRTVARVDHTYDGRRVARRTHTSVGRNALTALLRSRMGLLYTLFLQWCSSWQDVVWYSMSCSLSAVEELIGYRWYRGNVQTPGRSRFSVSVSRHTDTSSLVVIKVDRSTSSQYCAGAFSDVSSIFLKPFSGKKLMVVVLFCCCLFCITLLSQ